MYVLNRDIVHKCARSTDDHYLDIRYYDEKCLEDTYYNFRLGGKYKRQENELEWVTVDLYPQNVLRIEPGQYIRVRSMERFACSSRVMAIIGPKSRLQKMGIQMLHSPFIDSYFEGYLDLGLCNMQKFPVELPVGEQIGKIKFFDVSDTYPLEDPRRRQDQETWDERRDEW